MSDEMRIILAGFGGQGLLFAGKVLAHTGLIDDRHVSWLPSYGPEMRGGTANCSVVLSDEEIGSPLIVEPTHLIAMNQPSLDKFAEAVVPGGMILVDSTLINHMTDRTDVKVIPVPATKIAEDNGIKGLGNIVLVGKLFAETGFCERDVLDQAIRAVVPARKAAMVDKNLKALQLGIDA